MSETKNLRLFKHNEPLETNENKFDIDLALNQNWDKIEEFAGMVNDKVIELEDKDEEQDFNLQELQNEIKKDRENMINLEVEGQSIHIEDSSDLEGKLEVFGNVEQDVREGYNLYDYIPRVIATTKGLTVTKDTENGYLIVNGTPETDYVSIITGIDITDKLKDKTTYTLWQEKYDNKLFLQINARKADDSGYDYISAANQKKVFTVDKSKCIQYTITIQAGLKTQAGTFNNYKNRYMLYEGTEEKPYEPYGASPSPEYPSEIRAVGDNINLWDKENMLVELGGYSGSNGNKYDSTTRIRNTKDIELKKGIYTLSAEDSKLISVYIVNLKKEISSNGDSATFILEEDGTIRFTIENTALLNTKIKLERGNKKTSYSKFGQGSVEIRKQNENFFNKNNANILNAYIGVSKGNIVSGTYHRTVYLKVNKGTYTITKHKGVPGFVLGHTKTEPKLGDIVENLVNAVGKTVETISVENGYLVINIFVTSDYNANYTLEDIFNGLKVELGKVSTEYTEHKEETKILPIQKPMLIRDYFDKLNNKEVHTWKKIILDGVNNKVTQTTTNQSGKYRYQYIDKDLKNCSLSEEKAYCTHLPLIEKNKTYDKIVGFTVSNGALLIYTDGDTAVNFNANLQKENYIFYIPVIESAYEKIDLTPEQTKILDELDNFQTYKPVTNITTDSIAKLKLKYIADTKTYIDNKTSNLEQQVSVINQLLSTTKTSSVLLDNLQTDIESEVL